MYPRCGSQFSVIKILSICKLFVGWIVTKFFWKWLKAEEKNNVNWHTLKFCLLFCPYSDLLYTAVTFLMSLRDWKIEPILLFLALLRVSSVWDIFLVSPLSKFIECSLHSPAKFTRLTLLVLLACVRAPIGRMARKTIIKRRVN